MTRIERFLRLTGAWEEAARAVEYLDAVGAVAQQDGVTVTDEELQEAVDNLRDELGLSNVSDTLSWLTEAGLELEDMEREAELRVLEDKLCDRLDPRDVEDEFQNQRIRFDSVRLRVFVVGDQTSGRTLVRQLQDARDLFDNDDALKRCADWRMEWGWYLREELPEQAAAHIFRAMPGDVIGPLQVAEGRYGVYCVDALRPAILEADIERQIRKEMVAARTRMVLKPDDPLRFVLK